MHLLRIPFGAFHPSTALVLALRLEYAICMASLAILGFFGCFSLVAAGPLESSVIFGMHSGLALLNGYGIVVIPGSGWHTPVGYGARLLKESKEFVEQDPVDRESANRRRNRLRHEEESTACNPRCWSLMGGRVNWAGHAEEWFDAHLRK
ncbi:MAG: hypothetical protein JST93_24305 [Acidobacteria bacterium]|nr:hypothetical protein [Acidobacteriota bacterium]